MNSTSDLQAKLALSLVTGNERVLAAGPITHQPHTRPYRIVLVDQGHEFSVHSEVFEIDQPQEDLAAACQSAKSYFHEGNYFKPHDFVKAANRFAERLAKNIDHYIPSIMPEKVA
jgi:hypothetical protein